jgi:hypothetical protein
LAMPVPATIEYSALRKEVTATLMKRRKTGDRFKNR